MAPESKDAYEDMSAGVRHPRGCSRRRPGLAAVARARRGTGLSAGFAAPATVAGSTLAAAWSVEVGFGYGTPILVDGNLWVFVRQGEEEVLLSLDPETGQTRWRSGYAAPFEMIPATRRHGPGPKSTPAFADGRLFVHGMTGSVSAFDAATGELLWHVPGNRGEHAVPHGHVAAGPRGARHRPRRGTRRRGAHRFRCCDGRCAVELGRRRPRLRLGHAVRTRRGGTGGDVHAGTLRGGFIRRRDPALEPAVHHPVHHDFPDPGPARGPGDSKTVGQTGWSRSGQFAVARTGRRKRSGAPTSSRSTWRTRWSATESCSGSPT